MNEWQSLINIGAAAILGAMGWFSRALWDAVNKLKEELADLREAIAKEYIPKNDFKDSMSEIRRMFEVISAKLDNKADK